MTLSYNGNRTSFDNNYNSEPGSQHRGTIGANNSAAAAASNASGSVDTEYDSTTNPLAHLSESVNSLDPLNAMEKSLNDQVRFLLLYHIKLTLLYFYQRYNPKI